MKERLNYVYFIFFENRSSLNDGYFITHTVKNYSGHLLRTVRQTLPGTALGGGAEGGGGAERDGTRL